MMLPLMTLHAPDSVPPTTLEEAPRRMITPAIANRPRARGIGSDAVAHHLVAGRTGFLDLLLVSCFR